MLGTREHENEMQFVKNLGYKVILFNTQIDLEEVLEADYPVEMDLNSEEIAISKAIELKDQFDIRAVYTLNEYRIELSTRIANTLGLSGVMSYESVQNCRNKKRTRELLDHHKIGSAQFTLVKKPAEGLAALTDISLPVIVKPINEAGSNLVHRCDTPEDVWNAIELILQNSKNWVGQELDPEILLEEYLEGLEFSVEACSVSGEVNILAITEKQTTLSTMPIEVGHLVPASLSKKNYDSICQLVKEALQALSVDYGVTHTEVKMTTSGPRIIEVNARPAGDKIPLLVRAVTGYDLRELALHIALGGTYTDAPCHKKVASSAGIRFLLANKDGLVQLRNSTEIGNIPSVQSMNFTVKNGDLVKETTSNYNRLGYFIVHGDANQDANQIIGTVMERIQFCVMSANQMTNPN